MAGNKLSAEREELAALEQRMALKNFAAGEQEALREVNRELAELGYDEQQHGQVRQRFTEME